jgi:hypothetical protein
MVIRANPMYGKKWLNYILFLNARGSFHTQNWAYIHTEDLTGEDGVGRLYRSPHWRGWCWTSLERMVLEDCTEDLTGEDGVGRLYRSTEVLTGEDGVGRLYRSPHWRGRCWKTIQESSLERMVLEDYTEVLTEEDGVGRNSKPCLVYTLEGTLNQYLLSEVLTIRVGLCT